MCACSQRRTVDSDYDGVADRFDRCPLTSAGATVDAAGCPRDSDGDRVLDGLDKCPYTSSGARVDALGCPIDSDRDGIADMIDRCPNTPPGTPVDRVGCPRDSDGDGVPDHLDRCPATPWGARPVDANGCLLDSDRDGVPDWSDRCASTPPQARPVDSSGCPADRDADGVPDYVDRCPDTPSSARARVGRDGCASSVGSVTTPPAAPRVPRVAVTGRAVAVRLVRLPGFHGVCQAVLEISRSDGFLAAFAGPRNGLDLRAPDRSAVPGTPTPMANGGSMVSFRVRAPGRYTLLARCGAATPTVTVRWVAGVQP